MQLAACPPASDSRVWPAQRPALPRGVFVNRGQEILACSTCPQRGQQLPPRQLSPKCVFDPPDLCFVRSTAHVLENETQTTTTAFTETTRTQNCGYHVQSTGLVPVSSRVWPSGPAEFVPPFGSADPTYLFNIQSEAGDDGSRAAAVARCSAECSTFRGVG